MTKLDSVKKLTKTASLQGRVTKYKVYLVHQRTLIHCQSMPNHNNHDLQF